jgi:hypothetical protein
MVQALVMAVSPTAIPGTGTGENGSVAVTAPIMDADVARAYLAANMDLGILDDTEGDSPAGPSGGEPEPSHGEEDPVMGEYGPFWRIYPPVKVKQRNR